MSSVKLPAPLVVLLVASVLVKVTVFTPCPVRDKVPEVGVVPVSTVQRPLPSTVAVKVAPPTITVTVLFASAVPISTGVVSLVKVVVNSGAAGAVESSVKPPLPLVLLPAASVLVSVAVFAPSTPSKKLPETGALPVLIAQLPELSDVVVKVAPPTTSVTRLLASAVPLSTGVGSLVVTGLSVGVAGGVVSTVKLPVPGVTLPATSVLVSATG